MTLANLPEPVFVDTDISKILADNVAWYEGQTGKTLYPAQVEYLFINNISYRESLIRIAIQEAAKQTLVRYAKSQILDYLGALVGVTRIPATAAACTLEFTLPTAQSSNVLIPAATRVGLIEFATDSDVLITAGQLSVQVPATATTAGAGSNGIAIGDINTFVDDLLIDGLTVRNIDVTSGGSDEESDAHLQESIMAAHEGYTTAGSIGAYTFHSKRVSQTIIDVTVNTPGGGIVRIYPLTDSGLPSTALLDLIKATCSADRIRPLTDTVVALAPSVVSYNIKATIIPLKDTVQADVLAAAKAAAESYKAARSALLGLDIVRNNIVTALSVAGVYDVVLDAPAANIVLAAHEWAVCTSIDLQLGVAHDV